MAAPSENTNALKHGSAAYEKYGRLPPKSGHLRRLLNDLRRGIEAALVAKSGELTLYQRLRLQTAMRHEARARLLGNWLASDFAGLSVTERVQLVKEVGGAAELRDKALKELGLDTNIVSNPWDALDAMSRTSDTTTAAAPQTAADGPTADDAGHGGNDG